jgi:hypothetical protein
MILFYKKLSNGYTAQPPKYTNSPIGVLYVGINRWLLLGSTVGFCWDRPSALARIDRRFLLGLTVGFCWDRPQAAR